MDKKELMRKAVMLSEKSVKNGGGPFGAIIVKDGNIVAEASNSVTIDNDPTAHAEVNAIRKATSKLGTFDLQGCDIYTSLSLARCALVLSIGPVWIIFIMPMTVRMRPE